MACVQSDVVCVCIHNACVCHTTLWCMDVALTLERVMMTCTHINIVCTNMHVFIQTHTYVVTRSDSHGHGHGIFTSAKKRRMKVRPPILSASHPVSCAEGPEYGKQPFYAWNTYNADLSDGPGSKSTHTHFYTHKYIQHKQHACKVASRYQEKVPSIVQHTATCLAGSSKGPDDQARTSLRERMGSVRFARVCLNARKTRLHT
jgi:hypothetical protein